MHVLPQQCRDAIRAVTVDHDLPMTVCAPFRADHPYLRAFDPHVLERSTKDGTIRIDRRQSHLRLEDDEIFLWLAVQHRDGPQLSADIRLDQIAGISSRDNASRTADLTWAEAIGTR